MSLWKKIVGQTDLTPELKAQEEAQKEEKKKRRQEEAKRYQEEQEQKRERKRMEKEKKKAAELKAVSRFFGPDPSMGKKLMYSGYKLSFQYVDTHLLDGTEEVLGVIQAEYDKTKKTEIKGVLIATENRLIFAYVGLNSQYIEEFEYSKMKGLSLARDGFVSKELYIEYGRSRKKFDDITDDDNFRSFMDVVNERITHFRKSQNAQRQRRTPSKNSPDKYEQLEKLSELREKGILSQEEFESEKQKILN